MPKAIVVFTEEDTGVVHDIIVELDRARLCE